MHNPALVELGLNWRYLAFAVEPERLEAALEGAKAMGMIGLNLTVPHKLLAARLVDCLDDSASTWGAVNTILFEGRDENGEWLPLRRFEETPTKIRAHGFNTDADAIITSLKEDLQFEPTDRRILLLGAGGAGRTAALKLASCHPRTLFLVNRTEDKAHELAQEISSRYPDIEVTVGYPRADVDLALNATSLGLKPGDGIPFDTTRFMLSKAEAAYDMIYRPAKTPFLQAAETAGCRSANGLGMLLYQGAKALEIWTGQPAPVATMRAALEAHLQ